MPMPEEFGQKAREDQQRRAELVAAGATEQEALGILFSERWESYPEPIADAIRRHRADMEACRLMTRIKHRRCLLERGVPERHLLHVYDRPPDDTAAMTLADAYRRGADTFLVLSGPFGVGKSAAAVKILIDEIERLGDQAGRAAGLYVRATDIAPAVAIAAAGWAELVSTPMLVIDDVGSELGTAGCDSASTLRTLLCERYDRNLRTVLITNLTVNQLKRHLGARVADRIDECAKLVELGGQSRRRRDRGLSHVPSN
jgi:hypothetical protein